MYYIPQVTKINGGDIASGTEGLSWIESEKIVDTAVANEAINQIRNNNPKILFTHFDCVDAAGHSFLFGN